MPSPSAPASFRARQRTPVKPPHAKPTESPMQGNQNPLMRSQNTMGGKTPNMVPPAKNTSFMADGGSLQNRRMFADGGRGQAQGTRPPGSWPVQSVGPSSVHGQPQSSRPGGSPPRQVVGPRSAHGQAQGSHPPGMPHMADGGAAEDFGNPGDMDAPDAPPPAAAAPEPDGDEMGGGALPIIKPEAVAYHDDPQSCATCQYMGDDAHCAILQMMVSHEGGCNAFSAKAGEQPEGAPPMGAEPGEDSGPASPQAFGGQ